MITHLKDEEGKIIAYAEWRLVGPSGYETPNADHVWVNDFWIHPDYRVYNCINRIIDEIMRTVPQAQYCYFQRRAHNEKLRIYKRSTWERRRNAYDSAIIGRN